MKRLPKIAAAAVILAGIAALVWLLVGPGTATVAWADVQERIRNIRTLTFTAVTQYEGAVQMKSTVMMMEPDLMRQEMMMGESGQRKQKIVNIVDLGESKILQLVAERKEANVIEVSGLPQDASLQPSAWRKEMDWMARIKALIGEAQTELGEKEMADRKVKGYRVERDNALLKVWVDVETGALVEMEMTVLNGGQKTVMTDFQFDKELDRELFSLEIPEGYTVRTTQMDLSEPTEKDLMELFRLWTEWMDGSFPPVMERKATRQFMQYQIEKLKKAGQEPAKEYLQKLQTVIMKMSRGGMFVAQLPPESDWHYGGKGVELGQADKAVCWYKPKGSQTYRVIYADLSIKAVAEEDLPPEPDEAEPEAPGPAD